MYSQVGVEDVTLERIWPYNTRMDWLRRNWPDLLIGVALVVVIAMIVITLLSGGSLASLVRRDAPQPLATDAGGAQTTNGSATAGADAAGSTPANTQANASAKNQANTQASNQANTPAGGAATGGDYDVFVPGVPGRDTTADGGQAGNTAAVGNDASASGEQTGEQITDAAAEAGAGDAALPAASRTGGFRVAAGATNSRDGARTLAESYREDGLEVTVEQKDDLYLLWVGPYGTRADADVTAEAIIAGGGDALVYSFDGESDDTEAAADIAAEGTEGNGTALGETPDTEAAENDVTDSAADGAGNGDGTVLADNGAPRTPVVGTVNSGTRGGVTTGNAANTNANTGNTTSGDVAEDLAAGAGTGERYLQVGAFASDESAAPRLAQLEQLGLNVTNSEDAGGLLRLFVGPYGEAQIDQIQTRLDAQGIESFPVSQ